MNVKQISIIALLSSVMGGGVSLFGYKMFSEEDKVYHTVEHTQPVKFSNYIADTTMLVPEGMNFIQAAEVSTPAVVHIKTYFESNRGSAQRSPFEDMLRDYFGEQFPQHRGEERGGGNSPMEGGTGSGVIITSDGFIATNNHVIDKADKIEVTLNDKRSFTATVVGTDPSTDLAVLKIEEEGLKHLTFGNSESVKIGEWVLAVGNPFNLTSTVTAGIVSAKSRNINILRDRDNLAIESFIQTDAAVNPGNSGGALVDLRGNLVGINTAIATPTGSFSGYSFAVPAAIVKKVTGDIIKYGAVQRALLGVSIIDINSQLAREKSLENIKGVYVASVNETSAAAGAGIQEGDVITKVNDRAVNSAAQLQESIAMHNPGDVVKITFVRKGKVKEVDATLKNKRGDTSIVKREVASTNEFLGASLSSLSNEELKKLKIESGVKVMKVGPGKFRDAGISDGFIITSIDKVKVKEPKDIMSILDENRTGGVLIEGIYSNGQKGFYAIGF
ncbi:Do family serine endopeptidase [Cytophagaceae bacterium ABcell3]|nr:Do family serine endopeptidase [Cytophagaceae bacterium ABcell3]